MVAHEEAFLDEVLGLFVLEAQEWISQSSNALLELEHHPASDRKPKLFETIACSITNLGGSAATLELRDLEKLAFGLLPLLQVLQERSGPASAPQIDCLREGLNGIISAVQKLNETKTGAVPDLEPLLERISAAAKESPKPEPNIPADPPPSSPSTAVIDKLFDFQHHYPGTFESSRHLVDVVIKKAKNDYGERGWRYLDAASVVQIIDELDKLDDQFLAEVRTRLPAITGILSDCKSPNSDTRLSSDRRDTLLQEVQRLHDVAKSIEAKSIMLFFRGLHAFLTILTNTSVEISLDRITAVESRLNSIMTAAQQWAEMGKLERAAIQQVVCQ
jgi:hypothetical protein